MEANIIEFPSKNHHVTSFESDKLARNVINNSVRCADCSLHKLCMPGNLGKEDMIRISDLVKTHRIIKRGENLYRAGDAFKSLYAIRSGFFKTYAITDDGREQVTGFQMSGEIIGTDGIETDTHHLYATALDDSEVCVIPYANLEELAGQMHALQHHFHKIMSREITRSQSVMMMLGSMRAEERLAAFLLNLSQRFAVLGYALTKFHLRMTREEIGSYLGLKLETVSRAFSKFQQSGLISVQQKYVQIDDIAGLNRIVNSSYVIDGRKLTTL